MHYPTIYVGTIVPYEGSKPSAIGKRQITGGVMLHRLGLDGDEQAEKKVHGGPDRALCHYPREHYHFWRQQYPQQAEQFCAPALGENISTEGMTEENVFIGDIYRWGDAFIQVTQPRSPCYKLNYHMDIEGFSVQMQETGRCGWLYRIVGEGVVSEDQPLELVSRNSGISVAEAISICFHMPFDEEEYRRLMCAAGISASWSKTLQMRVLSGKIEDMNRRLLGA
ncbi:6-hydroxyaminopurine reductase [Hafnia paralvei]|jgi:MOSC domain-containing protein YiiM|uniref:6-hydroxyaminopurine reductase n=1 Tax=Hafnia paralvei TaxID=546367 RepID=UPI001033AF48|nr:6-hydroxyaminopurine reductase [Hafnia paralvei]TBM23939.1 6-N-hydroxylaminopurine resistance protein [Hafnia paralvei]